jgi:dienelactone hydrolase
MKQTFFYLIFAAVFVATGWFAHVAWTLPKEESPVSYIKPRPLEKYEIEKLSEKYLSLESPEIKLGKILAEEDDFTSHEFSYSFDPTMSGSAKKKVTGVINIPKSEGPHPLVILFRGYVDQTIYTPGTGSKRVAEYLANEGYITIAPDFLGYAGSDEESGDIFETRFQTYVTAVNLIKALDGTKKQPFQYSSVGIWAHSNGGQILLTALEITGSPIPSVLWAPNTAKFPYSILYYLDEAEDNGKLIITKLAGLMADYDTDKFTFVNYLDRLKSEFLIIQGTGDAAIPTVWNDNLVKLLKDKELEVKYLKYPGADHNMMPSWNEASAETMTFFDAKLKK